ncbi:hypothetical protein DL766_004748 [Monosporascus sp. MC13-8B]|uniref:cutinase n=1 Tax=Monosporascus cannonballus TaxID=155416 RepID=A0ABY0H606_9PEZI|nr:hypothetical protein DL762_006645 [Monosporascus cannonballus]RYO88480.1 hypothetical protein DL763_005979 [Monosporascus cannonballus]RYP30736.1 hypothetical protein DL766_004748 [Monosporascus sp. MC13-8B]
MESLVFEDFALITLLTAASAELSPVPEIDGVADEWECWPLGWAILARSPHAKFPSLAFQGVSAGDYAADMAGYIEEGGSGICAIGLARDVQQFASLCPETRFVISGWSQGALCARKSIGYLEDDARDRVIALVTFGDPYRIWSDAVSFPTLPESIGELSYRQMTSPDPLCSSPSDLFTDPFDIGSRLKAMWEEFDDARLNDAQRGSRNYIIKQLPLAVSRHFRTLLDDFAHLRFRRWMLLSQHFWYGIDGTVDEAAEGVFQAYNENVEIDDIA